MKNIIKEIRTETEYGNRFHTADYDIYSCHKNDNFWYDARRTLWEQKAAKIDHRGVRSTEDFTLFNFNKTTIIFYENAKSLYVISKDKEARRKLAESFKLLEKKSLEQRTE